MVDHGSVADPGGAREPVEGCTVHFVEEICLSKRNIKVSGRPTDRVSAVLLSSFVADFPEGFT